MIDLTRLLPRLLNANPDLAVKLAWARAAGTGLRRQAIPFRLEGRRLVVLVADAIWQKQLQSMSAELIFRMNNLLAQTTVNELVFSINPSALAEVQRETDKSSPRVDRTPAPAELLFAANSISDEDLRVRFIRAAENCISRREALIE